MNFTATRPGLTIPVTTASVSHSLGSDARQAVDAMLDNRGSTDVFVLFGDASTTVTKPTGARIPAGVILVLGKGAATHITVIADAATNLTVHLGMGV